MRVRENRDEESVPAQRPTRLSKSAADSELARLQVELVRMQEWIVHSGLRVIVVMEGRDTAGKGGTIKRRPPAVRW